MANRYQQLIEKLFFDGYTEGTTQVFFNRDDIAPAARSLNIALPKNLGDVVYSFRYRTDLPSTITTRAPEGKEWIILPKGRGRYCFVASAMSMIKPNVMLAATNIPDATPGIVSKYALNDEQGLLARVRYNRLIDIFTGVTCYSLQSHLRTTVPDMGQVETDELYVGIDKRGAHYVFPVQAKGGTDKLGIVQILQDIALCVYRFPTLICRGIAAQFIDAHLIALLAFEEDGQRDEGIALVAERHYRLVVPERVTDEDLQRYRTRHLEDV
ncbi:MAG: endonuclease [Chloroflexaceae bacterium]|nr:endonuclease [Chloroflexaceae bacterium]